MALSPALFGGGVDTSNPPPVIALPTIHEVILYKDSTPFVRGQFAHQPDGVILHGSRSGLALNTIDQEFDGTRNWCKVNPDGLAWTATIGELEYSRHMSANWWGWSAGEHSHEYMAVEFAQAVIAQRITDDQVTAFVEWFLVDARSAYPQMSLANDSALPCHSQLHQGIQQGKSDVYDRNDSARIADLRNRIRAEIRRRGATV